MESQLLDFYANGSESDHCWDCRQKFVDIYRATILVVILTMMVVGTTINSLVIYIIGRHREMQTATNFYVANLAVADIVLLVVCVIPVSLTLHVETIGRFTCKFLEYVMHVSVQATCLTLMAMTIDRYNIIVHAVRSRRTRTTRKALLVNIYIWTGSLLLQLPTFIFTDNSDTGCGVYLRSYGWTVGYHIHVLVATYLCPLLVILCCYLGILYKVWQKTSRGTESAEARNRSHYRKRRITRMVVIVVIAFAFCWLPHYVRRVWRVVDPNYPTIRYSNWELMNLLDAFILILSYSNSLINPFVYAFVTTSFRVYLFSTFCPQKHQVSHMATPSAQKHSTNLVTYV